jgi:hypothetical protein
MRGLAVPEIDRFIVLIHWLGFEPAQMFGIENKLNEPNEVDELIETLEKHLNVINETIIKYKKPDLTPLAKKN